MGIFQALVDKYKESQQKKENISWFKKSLLQAINDGKITSEEITQLDNFQKLLGLTDNDLKTLNAEIYSTAFKASKNDQAITKEEEIELNKIQQYLGLLDDEIRHDKKELYRLRLLGEIQDGNIPEIAVANIVCTKDEKIFWNEPSTLIEEKVIKRNYVGGSRGVSFRIMKGVSYRVGGHKGHIETETGLVNVSDGFLILTSKRVIYKGDKKSFAINIDKILDIQFFSDGITFSETNKAKQRMIKFKELGNHDIIGAILSHIVNDFTGR